MSKRKRELTSRSGGRPSQDQAHLEEALEHGKKSLVRALKLARGFERQKLGRRQKSARAKNEEGVLPRLAAEVTALKV